MNKYLLYLALVGTSVSVLADPPKVPEFKPGQLTQKKVDEMVALRQVILPVLGSVPVWLESKYVLTQTSMCSRTCQFTLDNVLPYNAHYLNLKHNYAAKGSQVDGVFDFVVEDTTTVDNYDNLVAQGYTPPNQSLYAVYDIKNDPSGNLMVGNLYFKKSKMDFSSHQEDSYSYNGVSVNLNSNCSIHKPECNLKVNGTSVYLNLNTGYVVIGNTDALDPKVDLGFINTFGQDSFAKFIAVAPE